MAENRNFGEYLDEIFAEGSDYEFEGFDLDDVETIPQPNGPNLVTNDNWVAGDQNPTPLNFTGIPGLLKEIDDVTSPIEFFELFIDDDDIEDIVNETNLYATQQIAAKNLKDNSRFKKWVDTSVHEMRRFIGLLLAMTLVTQLDISEYWTTDPVTSTPFFGETISRDRFYLILSFFHLCNNENYIPRGQEGHNPLYKLGRLYNSILYKFQAYYYPNRDISIDECMVPWRGNLSFKTYNPDKPSKYGLKAYMLCDSVNGYCVKFKLYTGKSSIPASENGATYDLIMDLLRGLYGRGHILYCDNYYSSPQLFTDLWDLGVGATGTVRPNRKGIPLEIKNQRLAEKGDTTVMHQGPLNLTKYLDHKPVYLLSTVCTSENVLTGK